MNKKTIQRAIAASMIALSVSGCSWIKSINPWGDGAPPDQVAQADPIPSDSPTLEPMRVTSHDGRVHSHVQDSSGKTITSGYGDCVNIGATLGDPSQTGDCDKQGLKPATDTATSGGEEMVKPAPAPAPAAATPAPMKETASAHQESYKITASAIQAAQRPKCAPATTFPPPPATKRFRCKETPCFASANPTKAASYPKASAN